MSDGGAEGGTNGPRAAAEPSLMAPQIDPNADEALFAAPARLLSAGVYFGNAFGVGARVCDELLVELAHHPVRCQLDQADRLRRRTAHRLCGCDELRTLLLRPRRGRNRPVAIVRQIASPPFASSLLIDVHAAQLVSSVITATGPVSFTLATPAAASWVEPVSGFALFGVPESPPPNSNTAATIVAKTATAATPPIAHLRLLLSLGPSVSDVMMTQLK